MTNTTYFYNTLRDYYDSSSSSSSEMDDQNSDHQAPLQPSGTDVAVKAGEAVAASSSLYTAIGKVCLACTRPPIQLENDDKSTITLIPRNEHPFRTDEEESRQKLSSKSVSPTCQCSTLKRFDFAELKTATANFFPEAVLDGNLDSVYKGWVDKHTLTASKFGMGMAVSVKVLNSKGFQDGEKWLEEVAYLGYLHHPNLVSLLGYCLEETTRRRLLVYEFPSRGSLEDLFDGPAPKVPWSLWLNVALDTAKGLAFLHSSKVVHGHFKPSNIFLDSNYNGKLFGFGLIKNSPTTFPIGVMETPTEDFGFSIGETTVYDAPEYLYTGQFSVESDVYCFGVVFLEILFGRRAFESFRPFSGRNLVKLIKSRPNLKPKFVNVVDSCTDCQLISGSKALELAIQCLSVEVKLRPTMDEVVEELGKLLNENKAGSNGSCC